MNKNVIKVKELLHLSIFIPLHISPFSVSADIVQNVPIYLDPATIIKLTQLGQNPDLGACFFKGGDGPSVFTFKNRGADFYDVRCVKSIIEKQNGPSKTVYAYTKTDLDLFLQFIYSLLRISNDKRST